MVTKDKQWCTFKVLRPSNTFNGYNRSKYDKFLLLRMCHDPVSRKQCGNRGSHRQNYLTEDVRYLNSQMYKNQTKIKEKSNFIVVCALQIYTYRIKCSLTIIYGPTEILANWIQTCVWRKISRFPFNTKYCLVILRNLPKWIANLIYNGTHLKSDFSFTQYKWTNTPFINRWISHDIWPTNSLNLCLALSTTKVGSWQILGQLLSIWFCAS